MPGQGLTFDDNAARRIVRAVKTVERDAGFIEQEWQDTGNDGNFDDWVLITGAISGSWYPGKLQTFTTGADTWADVAGPIVVYIREANGGSLTNGSRYRGNIVGTHSSATAYETVNAAAGSLTVKEVDGTPTVSPVSTLQFDQVDGFTVSDLTGGLVQLDMLTATQTQKGTISLLAQVMGDGAKTFPKNVIISPSAQTVTYDLTVGLLSTTQYGNISTGGAVAATFFNVYSPAALAAGGSDGYATRATGQYSSGTLDYVITAFSSVSSFPAFTVRAQSSGYTATLADSPGSGSSYRVGANVGVTQTQPVGTRGVYKGGLCIGFV